MVTVLVLQSLIKLIFYRFFVLFIVHSVNRVILYFARILESTVLGVEAIDSNKFMGGLRFISSPTYCLLGTYTQMAPQATIFLPSV